MRTRMSDDRDDHISRSKTNDPTRDTRVTRESAHTRRRTTHRLLLRSFILLFIFYIFSDETVVNNRIDFCFYVSR